MSKTAYWPRTAPVAATARSTCDRLGSAPAAHVIGYRTPDLGSHRQGDTYYDVDSGMTYETYVAAPGTAVAWRYLIAASHDATGLCSWYGAPDRAAFLAFIPADADVLA